MKKLFLLTLILFSLLSSQVFACEQQTTTVNEIIDYVYYDDIDQVYYANTVPDKAGGSWTVILISGIEKDENIIKRLYEAFKGKQVDIVYTGNLDNADEIEIISSEIRE